MSIPLEVRDARDRAMVLVQSLQGMLSRYFPAREVRDEHAKVSVAVEAYAAASEAEEDSGE